MKVLIIFVICFAMVSATAPILGLGKTCMPISPFVITSFEVNPFPPTSGQDYSISMTGTFSQSRYVKYITKKVSFNGSNYVKSYTDYDQKCTSGQIYTFSTSLTAGNQAGLYNNRIELEDSLGLTMSCWEYSYHI